MLASKKYINKKIAIYGMGLTGQSAAKKFKDLKANVLCWDDNVETRKKIKKFKVDKFWLKKDVVDNIVISPGIDINKCKIKKFLKKNLKKIITDLDLFFEINKDKLIISITGTNGKSTTCKIVEKILKEAKYDVSTVGNIGKPILSSTKLNKNKVLVIEVSSYQLQYSKLFHSKHAAILNITPDHLERHKNLKNYIKIKSRIFYAQKKSDYTYINLNNRYAKEVKKIFKIQNIKSKLIQINKFNFSLIKNKIKNNYFKSAGNIENLLFAYYIAKNLKIKDSVIIKALNYFKGLPHRQEVIYNSKKLVCINDSKATSFDASLQCLSNYNNIYWIVGGIPKDQDKFYLNEVKRNIKKAYIIGKQTSFFSKELKHKIPYSVSHNLRNAFKNICIDIKLNKNSKNTILLSPAAASFDQFKNFETRGVFFKSLVKKNLNV
jgi:UDP-N-acetylmuramoylalanine--D-glutamate ligase